MADTVRERIMLELVKRVEDMQPPEIQWHVIRRTALNEELDTNYENIISIMDTDEEYNYLAGFIEPLLRVDMEFWLQVRQGSAPSTDLNKALGDLTTLVLQNHALIETGTDTPLTINMQIVESVKDIAGPQENVVSGLLSFDVLYRHKATDPTALR